MIETKTIGPVPLQNLDSVLLNESEQNPGYDLWSVLGPMIGQSGSRISGSAPTLMVIIILKKEFE
jgi:hypothetical protein